MRTNISSKQFGRLCFSFILSFFISWPQSFAETTYQIRAIRLGQTLSVTLESGESVTSDCGLFVQSFIWDQAQSVSLSVKPNSCFVDRVGKPRVTWTWLLPVQLRGDTALRMILNSTQKFDISLSPQPGRLHVTPVSESR